MAPAFIFGELAVLYGKGIIVILCIIVCVYLITTRDRLILCLVVICAFCGTGYVITADYVRYEDYYDNLEDGQAVSVQGDVYKTEEKEKGFYCFVETSNGVRFLAVLDKKNKISRGDTITFKGNIEHFDNVANEGNFDEKSFYESLGVLIKVSTDEIVQVQSTNNVISSLHGVHNRLLVVLDKICNGRQNGVARAILLGDKSKVSDETERLYQIASISHIASISGLHIGILGMLLYKFLRKIGGYKIASILSFVFVMTFVVMIGLPVSAVRALIMFGITLLGQCYGRTYDGVTSLSLAVLFILADNPFYLFNAGFQMSVAAVAGIFFVHKVASELFDARSRIGKSILFTISVNMTVIPIVLWNYYEIATYGIIANLLFVPLATVVLMSGMAGVLVGTVSLGLGSVLILPCVWILELYEQGCILISKLPCNMIVTGKPEVINMFAYYIALSVVLIGGRYISNKRSKEEGYVVWWWIRYSTRIVGTIIIASLFVVLSVHFRSGLEITFLDMGQGQSVFIREKNGKVILFDGGSTSVTQPGKYRLEGFIKSRGVKNIDYVIISHTDADHCNAVLELLQDKYTSLEIKNIILPPINMDDEAYTKFVDDVNRHGVNIMYARGGDTMSVDGVNVEFLHPDGEYKSNNINDYSLVIHMKYKKFSALFTGDITDDAEKYILKKGILEEVDLLQVAHHGSKYSTSEEFLDAVRPDIAVITAGKNNMYGHPHSETLERLEAAEIDVFTTSETGAVMLEIEEKMVVRSHKNQLNE